MKWNCREPKFKQIMTEYDGTLPSLRATNQRLAELLRTETAYSAFNREAISELETADTETMVNEIIALVYDFADEHRIWLGFAPQATSPQATQGAGARGTK